MHCRDFEEQHVAFVDDVLSAEDMAAMREHLRRCPRCAQHDIAVRRGLLVARNLPTIQCSADFMDRLEARLRESGPAERHGRGARHGWQGGGTFAVLAASVFAIAGLATAVTHWSSTPRTIRLAPVVASRPEAPPSAMPAPVYVASLAVGLPVWPAVIAADQTPFHLADVELQETSSSR